MRLFDTAYCAVALAALAAPTSYVLASPPIKADVGKSVIAVHVQQIRGSKNTNTRTISARDLYRMVESRNVSASANDIKMLSNLMSDRDDSVRFWIARALAEIGPSAHAAIPALQKAYRQIACGRGDLTSSPAIQRALDSIGGQLPVVICKDGHRAANWMMPRQ